MTALDVIDRVRRLIGEVPGDEEDVWDDASVEGSPTTSVSDRRLVWLTSEAQRDLATRVKAAAVPQLVSRYAGPFPGAPTRALRPIASRVYRDAGRVGHPDGPSYDPAGYAGSATDGATAHVFVSTRYARFTAVGASADATTGAPDAVLYGPDGAEVGRAAVAAGLAAPLAPALDLTPGQTVTVRIEGGTAQGLHVWLVGTVSTEDDGTPCTQRTPPAHRRMEAAGRRATADYPVFTWSPGRLDVHPAADDAAAYFVVAPDEIDPDAPGLGSRPLPVGRAFLAALSHAVAARVLSGYGRAEEAAAHVRFYQSELAPYVLGVSTDPGYDDDEALVEGN